MDRTAYFTAKLAYETDASDLYAALKAGEPLTVVDVRSDDGAQRISPELLIGFPQVAGQG